MPLSPLGNRPRFSAIRRNSSTAPSRPTSAVTSKESVESLPSGFRLTAKELNFEIPRDRQVIIGRQTSCDLTLEDPQMSRRHAVLQMRDGNLQILDPGSSNGTFVNGERLKPKSWQNLSAGSTLKMGDIELKLRGAEESPAPPSVSELAQASQKSAAQVAQGALPALAGLLLKNLKTGALTPLSPNSSLSIGRTPSSELKLEDAKASRSHALLQTTNGIVSLQDQGSSNGSFLNGQRLQKQEWSTIEAGDRLRFGDTSFQLVGATKFDTREKLEQVIDFRELIVDPKEQKAKYGQIVPDQTSAYWQNNAEARQVFESYLDKGDLSDPKIFESTLKKSHRLAVEGSSGGSRYYKKRGVVLDEGRLPAGEFHSGVTGGIRDKQSQQVEELALKYGDPYRSDAAQAPSVALSGIEKEKQPGNVVFLGGQRHIYPQPSAFGNYFGQMQNRLKTLDKLPAEAKKEKLQAIGEFYHYAANVRPFHNVNNSLFMNLTNSLLKRHGFKPVYHGILDHAAHRLQPDAFNQHFKDWATGVGRIS